MLKTIMSQHTRDSILISLVLAIGSWSSFILSIELFNVKLVEYDDARLIATSNYNYAITSPKLITKGWRTLSVNGDTVTIVTASNEKLIRSMANLDSAEKIFIQESRDDIANRNIGFSHVSSTTGGSTGNENIMMSSSSHGNAGAYSTLTSSFSSMNPDGNYRSNDVTVSIKNDDNLSISKQNLPFNWSQVFINGDLVTFVYKGGEVEMQPQSTLTGPQLEAVNELKREAKDIQRKQSAEFSNTMQHSMDMVSNVFSNIMGNFPKPPSYSSAVGGMFGDKFPFGPNNSPFSASSGWPFGSGAFAMANGRR